MTTIVITGFLPRITERGSCNGPNQTRLLAFGAIEANSTSTKETPSLRDIQPFARQCEEIHQLTYLPGTGLDSYLLSGHQRMHPSIPAPVNNTFESQLGDTCEFINGSAAHLRKSSALPPLV